MLKNMELADLGKKRIEWANQSMKVLQTDPQGIHQEPAAQGDPHFRLPARDQRDREPDDRLAGRRRRGGAVRFQSAVHAGRRCGLLVRDYGIPVFAIKGEDNDATTGT